MSDRSNRPDGVKREVWERLDHHGKKLNRLLSKIRKLEDEVAALRSDSPVSEKCPDCGGTDGLHTLSCSVWREDLPASTGGERDEHADDGDLYYAGRAHGYAKAVQDLMVVGEVEGAVPVEIRVYDEDDQLSDDRAIESPEGIVTVDESLHNGGVFAGPYWLVERNRDGGDDG